MRRVHQLQEEEPEAKPEWVNVIKVGQKESESKREVKCAMLIDDEAVHFQIDTGSSVNLLPKKYATEIKPTNKVLRTWDQGDFKPEGSCRRVVKNPRLYSEDSTQSSSWYTVATSLHC